MSEVLPTYFQEENYVNAREQFAHSVAIAQTGQRRAIEVKHARASMAQYGCNFSTSVRKLLEDVVITDELEDKTAGELIFGFVEAKEQISNQVVDLYDMIEDKKQLRSRSYRFFSFLRGFGGSKTVAKTAAISSATYSAHLVSEYVAENSTKALGIGAGAATIGAIFALSRYVVQPFVRSSTQNVLSRQIDDRLTPVPRWISRHLKNLENSRQEGKKSRMKASERAEVIKKLEHEQKVKTINSFIGNVLFNGLAESKAKSTSVDIEKILSDIRASISNDLQNNYFTALDI